MIGGTRSSLTQAKVAYELVCIEDALRYIVLASIPHWILMRKDRVFGSLSHTPDEVDAYHNCLVGVRGRSITTSRWT